MFFSAFIMVRPEHKIVVCLTVITNGI